MGDALDDDEFEPYAPEEEGELASLEGDEGVAAVGDGAGERSSHKKGRKRKKGAAGSSASASGVAEQPAQPHADEDQDEKDDEDAGGGEAGQEGKKEKKKKKKKRKKGGQEDGGGSGGAGGMATAEGQSAFLWERYCDLLDVSPLDRERDGNLFPPSRFALPIGDAPPPSDKAKQKQKEKQQQQQQQGKGGKEGKKEAATLESQGAAVADFLKRVMPEFQRLASDKAQRVVGSPLVLVVSSSAVRANELAKDLRVRVPNQKTAKLFAKHLKLPEQVATLQKEYHALAVGTPNRLAKLVEAGALSLGACRLLVLDVTWRDSKQFHVLTLPGVAKDTALLLRDHVLPAMAKEKGAGQQKRLRIALF